MLLLCSHIGPFLLLSFSESLWRPLIWIWIDNLSNDLWKFILFDRAYLYFILTRGYCFFWQQEVIGCFFFSINKSWLRAAGEDGRRSESLTLTLEKNVGRDYYKKWNKYVLCTSNLLKVARDSRQKKRLQGTVKKILNI